MLSSGYRGDSVYATQAHFVDCLETGRPCESSAAEYLEKTFCRCGSRLPKSRTGRRVQTTEILSNASEDIRKSPASSPAHVLANGTTPLHMLLMRLPMTFFRNQKKIYPSLGVKQQSPPDVFPHHPVERPCAAAARVRKASLTALEPCDASPVIGGGFVPGTPAIGCGGHAHSSAEDHTEIALVAKAYLLADAGH